MSEKNTNEEVLASLALLPFLVFLSAYTFQKLWLWFVVPLGVPGVTMLHGVGLTFLIAFFRDVSRKGERKDVLTVVTSVLGQDLGLLLFGYLVHYFM
jgi:hypothetical protein